MPLLNLPRWSQRKSRTTPDGAILHNVPRSGESLERRLLGACSNPACRSGWLHVWRSSTVPVFEGGWLCSRACTESRLDLAVRRELGGRNWEHREHRHRIPIGLVMLEQGWITRHQLRQALNAQRARGQGTIGHWLIQQKAATDATVARALALQWSCPVMTADPVEASALTTLLPRLFIDAFAALPLRLASSRVLYLGFERQPDPVLAFGIEQITGLRVENGIVPPSQFTSTQSRVLASAFPRVELIEAAHAGAAARAFAGAIERTQPCESRLTRIHDCLWLRMWHRPQSGPLAPLDAVTDLICSIGIS